MVSSLSKLCMSVFDIRLFEFHSQLSSDLGCCINNFEILKLLDKTFGGRSIPKKVTSVALCSDVWN